jgi:probable F420-dependent oxidoreductase
VGTGVAIAFARNPMTIAYQANDLQLWSQGRFMLGLGSQVKPHIERRFGMPWGQPAARMREFVLALRAIWAAWESGEQLSSRGEFYQHTLMPPFFSPGPNPYGNPPVFLAAVGPRMTEVAGQVADGLLLHSFTTLEYLHETTLAALERGLQTAQRTRADLQLSMPVFVATGDTDEAMAAAKAGTKKQLAFYASTPTYRPVLERHGLAELGERLTALSRTGEATAWDTMGSLIDDEVLDLFAVVADPADAAEQVLRRYGGLLDRISIYTPYECSGELIATIADDIRARSSTVPWEGSHDNPPAAHRRS